MMKRCLLLIFLTAIFACAGVIHAIDCYACSYTNAIPSYNPFCNVQFDANSISAALSVAKCDGICVKESGQVGGLSGVERRCDTNMTLAECENDCGGVQGTTIGGCRHCCETDLCNGASSVTFNLLAAAAMLVLAGAITY